MKQFRHAILAMMLTALTGCAKPIWQQIPMLALPVDPSHEQQVELLQLNKELRRRDIDGNVRLQLLYERGSLLDQFGLNVMAQTDFLNVMRMRPDVPEIYNELGSYAVQIGELDSAYLAFDSALELDPNYKISYLNRGIALYNGERYKLAKEDFYAYFKSNPDPIVLLWIYLVEQKTDPRVALSNLRTQYQSLKDKVSWGADIVRFYLGMISEQTLLSNAQNGVTNNRMLAERLSEAYFYLAKYYLNKGDEKSAETLFKLTLANNIRYFVEYRQALLEIEKLGQNKTPNAVVTQ